MLTCANVGHNAITFLKLWNPKNDTLRSSVIVTVVIVIFKIDYLIAHADN
jgi:hypothetical protein